MQLRILISEWDTIQLITISDSLARLTSRSEFELKSLKPSDLRIRNLEFADDMVEMSLANYRLLATLAPHYDKMDKALDYYARKYSSALVDSVVGNFDNFFHGLALNRALYQQSLDNPDEMYHLSINDIDLADLPKRVIGELRHYFNEPFIIDNVRLSDEQHANAKFADDTAEFRILFTVLDVAMPDEAGIYQRGSLAVDIFGRYDNQIYFDFERVKTDKSKFLGYDDVMYDKRHAYLQMIFDNCQDKDGKPLRQVLEAVAQTYVYDFWLE